MILNVSEVNYNIFKNADIVKRRKGNQGSKERSRINYKNLVCAFDIESSTLSDIDQSFMYIWQFQLDNYATIIGRTWKEFNEFLSRIEEVLNDNEYLVIYVHNLSYEFQFLRGIYKFKAEEVFCLESRKILKCKMYDHFEFRCSYMLSNMTLDRWLNHLNVEHKKLSGEQFDYNKVRFPWTELSDYEIQYCINDVKGVVEALKITLEKDNDDLNHIPLTSTGYVRRDVKESLSVLAPYIIKNQMPNKELYIMSEESMRGGDTHTNRFFSNEIIRGNITGCDIASSYPAQQLLQEFPQGKWHRVINPDINRVMELYNDKNGFIARVKLHDIKLIHEWWGCPYIAKAKIRNYSEDCVFDNGRLLEGSYCETTLTDIDLFQIMLYEYNFEVEFEILYYAKYKRLPKQLRDVILDYYDKKTSLKGIAGAEYYYKKNKGKLNSIYGLTCSHIVREEIEFSDNEYKLKDFNIEKQLQDYYRKGFVIYQWGVFTTAWARKQLHDMIRSIGFELPDGVNLGRAFLYCDTDSVYFYGNIDLEKINKPIIEKAKELGAYADDIKGERHYIGIWDLEHNPKDLTGIKEFKSMGAKKYVYRTNDNKLTLTLAGVHKTKGAQELEEAGGIAAFSEGFIFNAGGGNELIYNDDVDDIIEIDGKKLHITPNVVIKRSTYRLGMTEEYSDLLINISNYLKKRKNIIESKSVK